MTNARETRHAGRRYTSFVLALVGILALAGQAAAQDTCDVEFQLDEPGPINWVAFSVDYAAAAGEFVGDSTLPGFGPSWGTTLLACTPLVTYDEFTAVDDGASHLMNVSLARLGSPYGGPSPLVRCVYALAGGFPCPSGSDFVVGNAVFPSDPITPPPLPPAPAIAVLVTPRTPVCGDGFREGLEDCDDGNTSDGDCCSSTCTVDPAGTPCADASVCTSGETCDDGGVCVPGATLVCDDGLPCTHDVCDPALGCQAIVEPDPACHPMTQAKLTISDKQTTDVADRFKINAKTGGPAGAIGNPTTTTAYDVCVFDAAGGVASVALQMSVPPGPPWAVRGGSGSFGYVDKTRSNAGIEKIRLKQNPNGIVKLLVIGKGDTLELPGPVGTAAYFSADPAVAIQVKSSDASCWRSTLTTLRNDALRFAGKH